MPTVNDYVNYGTQGICKVADIRTMKLGSSQCSKEYFLLKPVHQEHMQIFVPVDNPMLVAQMRPVLSVAEIDKAILSVKNTNMTWIDDRKRRMEQFQRILIRRDERELLLLVSCLYLRGKENPKGLSSADAQIQKLAETMIEQEFSFSLKIHAQSVGEYIRKKLNINELERPNRNSEDAKRLAT